MSKYIVVTFQDETSAYEGISALGELSNEGSISLYSSTAITKNEDGTIAVKDTRDSGPFGTSIGMLTGGLIGLIGGPVGLAIGIAGGATVGALADLANAGVGSDFADEVGRTMEPGTYAVIAEIDEYWTVPVDSRMGSLGGTVMRRFRIDVVDEQLERDAAAREAELQELTDEWNEATDDAKEAVQKRIDDAKASVSETQNKISARVEHLEHELNEKTEKLRTQIEVASERRKMRMQARQEEIHADYDRRIGLLKEAGRKLGEALS